MFVDGDFCTLLRPFHPSITATTFRNFAPASKMPLATLSTRGFFFLISPAQWMMRIAESRPQMRFFFFFNYLSKLETIRRTFLLAILGSTQHGRRGGSPSPFSTEMTRTNRILRITRQRRIKYGRKKIRHDDVLLSPEPSHQPFQINEQGTAVIHSFYNRENGSQLFQILFRVCLTSTTGMWHMSLARLKYC